MAAELGGRAVIGPSLPSGSRRITWRSPARSRSTTTFAALVREYVDSLYRHGWRKILVVTGHGGNNATLATVAQDLLVTQPDLEFARTPLTALAPDAVADMRIGEVHGHSGEAETAQMLDSRRISCTTTGSPPASTPPPISIHSPAVPTRPPHPAVRYDRLSANGVLGDPRRATTEAGQAIVDTAVRRIVAFVKEWLDA